MADIGASDITYTLLDQKFTPGVGYKNVVQIAFGSGSLNYVTGGIALAKAKLGCPTTVSTFLVIEGAVTSGYLWDWDYSTEKLVGFQSNTAANGLIQLAATVQPVAQNIIAEVEGY